MTNKQLNNAIHKRDGDRCIICGRFVAPGEKWHHEKKNGKKEDNLETGVTLCFKHHQERHFGKDSMNVKNGCKKYLMLLYPSYWLGKYQERG